MSVLQIFFLISGIAILGVLAWRAYLAELHWTLLASALYKIVIFLGYVFSFFEYLWGKAKLLVSLAGGLFAGGCLFLKLQGFFAGEPLSVFSYQMPVSGVVACYGMSIIVGAVISTSTYLLMSEGSEKIPQNDGSGGWKRIPY